MVKVQSGILISFFCIAWLKTQSCSYCAEEKTKRHRTLVCFCNDLLINFYDTVDKCIELVFSHCWTLQENIPVYLRNRSVQTHISICQSSPQLFPENQHLLSANDVSANSLMGQLQWTSISDVGIWLIRSQVGSVRAAASYLQTSCTPVKPMPNEREGLEWVGAALIWLWHEHNSLAQSPLKVKSK